MGRGPRMKRKCRWAEEQHSLSDSANHSKCAHAIGANCHFFRKQKWQMEKISMISFVCCGLQMSSGNEGNHLKLFWLSMLLTLAWCCSQSFNSSVPCQTLFLFLFLSQFLSLFVTKSGWVGFDQTVSFMILNLNNVWVGTHQVNFWINVLSSAKKTQNSCLHSCGTPEKVLPR